MSVIAYLFIPSKYIDVNYTTKMKKKFTHNVQQKLYKFLNLRTQSFTKNQTIPEDSIASKGSLSKKRRSSLTFDIFEMDLVRITDMVFK